VPALYRERVLILAGVPLHQVLTLGPNAITRSPINVPAVAFAGGTDGVLHDDLESYERARRRFKTGYEVIQLPGGHWLHREHPDEFRRELLRVLTAETGRP
jgi:pimeloyl-ACP methyl ester carboxylesterase